MLGATFSWHLKNNIQSICKLYTWNVPTNSLSYTHTHNRHWNSHLWFGVRFMSTETVSKFHPSASLWCFNCYVLRNLNWFQVSLELEVHFHNDFFSATVWENQVMMNQPLKSSHFESNQQWSGNYKWLMIKSNSEFGILKSSKLIWIFQIPAILIHSLRLSVHF